MSAIIRCLLCLSLALGLTATPVAAQSEMKVGYVKVEYVLSKMPETKQMNAELKTTNSDLQNQLQQRVAEYQNALKENQRNQLTMSDSEKKEKKAELVSMQRGIREFEISAQTSIQRKRAELMSPVLQKLEESIKSVAESNAYTHVFSDRVNGTSVLLYTAPEHDLTNLVLSDMGIDTAQ